MTLTGAIARGRSLGWHAQLWSRHGARTLRRHYGSIVTLGVLSVALVIALTSSSFTGSGRNEETITPPSSASRIQLAPGFRQAIAAAPEPRVTYYLYEDEAERRLLADILRRDYTNMTRMGLPDYIGEVHFLHVSTDLTDDSLSFLLSEVVALAKVDGLTVSIVDLR